jgi:hypothetical protein
MEVRDASNNNSAEIVQNRANSPPGDHQKWRITTAVGDMVKIMNVKSGRVFDVPNNRNAVNTRMIQWADQNSINQRFKLEPVAVGFSGSSGTYNIITNRGMSLDIEGSDKMRDGLLVVTNTSQGNAQSQQWRIDQLSDGTYTITNVLSGRLMEAKDGATGNVDVVQNRAANPVGAHQRWRITAVGEEVKITNVNSGRVLDVHSNNPAVNTRMIQYSDNNAVNQRFRLVSVGESYGQAY